MGSRATLNFRKFKVALSPIYTICLNFAKSCISSCLSKFLNKKNFTLPFLQYTHFKMKLRVFLSGYSVAMVTVCVTKIKPTCHQWLGSFFWNPDCSINWLRVVKMTHQNLKPHLNALKNRHGTPNSWHRADDFKARHSQFSTCKRVGPKCNLAPVAITLEVPRLPPGGSLCTGKQGTVPKNSFV